MGHEIKRKKVQLDMHLVILFPSFFKDETYIYNYNMKYN